jgi:outer membrane protein, heavy metal efflux system
MKRILNLFCVASALTSGAVAGEATNSVLLDADYILNLSEIMRTNHPALRGADQRVRAAQAATEAVRNWEDPELMIGGMAARRPMRAEDGDIIYGVTQPLPLFGRPRAAREAARAGADVAVAEADLRFQLLRRDLSQTLFESAVVHEKLHAAELDVAYLETLEATARARYESGAGSQLEVLRIRNELSRRREELATARLETQHEVFTLNRLLNRPFTTPWPRLLLPEPAPQIYYNRELVKVASQFEPMIQVLRKRVEAAGADTEVARRRYRPEISVGLEGSTYSGDGSFRQGTLLVGMKLPWFNRSRYRAEVDQSLSLREALEEELIDQQLETSHEVHDLIVKIDDARRRARLQRGEIVPRTRQMLESAHAAWVSGSGQVRDLLEIRRLLVEAELAYHRAVADQYIALSELILCCGLSDLEMVLEVGSEPDPDLHHAPEPSTPR